MLALKTSKQTVERFAFSADGRYLAVAGSSWKVHLWDLAAKRLKAQTLPTLTGGTGAPGCQFDWLGFLPNGQLFSLSAMGEYVVHDPATGAPHADVPLLAGKPMQGAVTVYVCRNYSCQAPVIGAAAVELALS